MVANISPNSDPEVKKTQVKTLGDLPYRPVTQNVGAFVLDGAAEDLEMIEKLARGYVYMGKSKAEICNHNADVGDRKSTRLNSSHPGESRMPSSA